MKRINNKRECCDFALNDAHTIGVPRRMIRKIGDAAQMTILPSCVANLRNVLTPGTKNDAMNERKQVIPLGVIYLKRRQTKMESYVKILNIVKYVGGTILTLGIVIFLYGFFVNDSNSLTGIGIGTVMGAVFIFLMGVFLVASEDMVTKIKHGK